MYAKLALAALVSTFVLVLAAEASYACSGIKRVLGLWFGQGRGFQRGRLSKFVAGAPENIVIRTDNEDSFQGPLPELGSLL